MSDSTVNAASSSTPLPTNGAGVMEGFWQVSGEAKKGLRGMAVEHGAALQHLGASPFTKTGFPILGLLETVYEHVVAHGSGAMPGDVKGS